MAAIIQAEIMADSLNPYFGNRLVTWNLRYPRCIHSEIMTHRVFARNAESSRARPVSAILKQIEDEPYIPIEWGTNQKGMQAGEPLSGQEAHLAEVYWLMARNDAMTYAKKLIDLGVHKQWANRILEPWAHISVVLSGTEWDNFFALRCDPAAMPEFRTLACLMRDKMAASTPVPRLWHVPFVTEEELAEWPIEYACKVAVGRLARVSYLTHLGVRDPAADVDLCNRLMRDKHMCYDQETEVLTSGGFVNWSSVTEESRLATFDCSTSNLVGYEQPRAILRKHYSGPIIAYDGAIDLVVTPQHRLYTSLSKTHGSRVSPSFRLMRADGEVGSRYIHSSVADSPMRMALASADTDIGGKYDDADVDWARLVGFIVGDGHAESDNTVSFGLRKRRKIEWLGQLCGRLNLPVTYRPSGTIAISMPRFGYMVRKSLYCGMKKQIPVEYLSAPGPVINGLLDGLCESDGSAKRSSWVFTNASRQVIDMTQALGAIVGQPSTVVNVTENCWRVVFRTRSTMPHINDSRGGSKAIHDAYEGNIYCANVSTGLLMIRRNGKTLLSGNSPFEHVAFALRSGSQNRGCFTLWRQFRQSVEDGIVKLE